MAGRDRCYTEGLIFYLAPSSGRQTGFAARITRTLSRSTETGITLHSRRRCQFRLRSLAVAVTVACLGLYCFQYPLQNYFLPKLRCYDMEKVEPIQRLTGIIPVGEKSEFDRFNVFLTKSGWEEAEGLLFRNRTAPTVDFDNNFVVVLIGEGGHPSPPEFLRGRSGRLHLFCVSSAIGPLYHPTNVKFHVTIIPRDGVSVVLTDPPTRVSYFAR